MCGGFKRHDPCFNGACLLLKAWQERCVLEGVHMVTVLIDRLPTEWGSTDVSELLQPFEASHVCVAADACGNLLGFVFVFFADERSANKALMALDLMGTPGVQLSVIRAVAPRKPDGVTDNVRLALDDLIGANAL